MKPLARERHEEGQVFVLIMILLAMAGGAIWYAHHAHEQKDAEARAFASEVGNRVILQSDTRFLNVVLSPAAKVKFPPSWRDRMFEIIHAQGPPLSAVRVNGDMQFQYQFMDPEGRFRAEVDYPNGPAYLQFNLSHPGVIWQIDDLNFIWQRPPEPSPTPTFAPSAIPVLPSPDPAKRKSR